jgi:hexosaminidase
MGKLYFRQIIFAALLVSFIFSAGKILKAQHYNSYSENIGNNIPGPNPQPTQLYSLGYSVIPSPRNVVLGKGEFDFGNDWKLNVEGISRKDIAVDFLQNDLEDFYGIKLDGNGTRTVNLHVKSGTVETGGEKEIEKQAYRLVIKPDEITITGNAPAGLFYGVQTLVQLVKEKKDGSKMIPECTITDWPSMKIRMIHWDTKNHQDRMETLKRYLDWSARFKINGIAFEVWDKFEFPSHPIIGAPNAFTPKQLQELVDYGLERHIQIVPDMQAPAHFSWVLKHDEFDYLRSGLRPYSEACVCDERTYDLIFELYTDLINATKGVEYFLASTDELFTVGSCDKCDKPYTPENKSLYFAEYVNRADEFLRSKGRKTIAWLEMPLLTKHVELINPEVIDGVGRGHLGYFVDNEEFIEEENKRGIQLINYAPIQGGMALFPDYFYDRRRLNEAYYELSYSKTLKGDVIGSFIAAWDDRGLHNETFWLGWATGAQYSWTPGIPSVAQNVSEFMKVYYGQDAVDMEKVYRTLEKGARFYEASMDRMPASDIRRSGIDWGGPENKSYRGEFEGRFHIPSLPPLPNMNSMTYEPAYGEKYAEEIERARELRDGNEQITEQIHKNMSITGRNDYNLRVFLALADYQRHHLDLILDLANVQNQFEAAHRNALDDPPLAIVQLTGASDAIAQIIEDRKTMYQSLKEVYEVSQFPKGQSVGGKKFVQQGSGRIDLSFMTEREENLQLDKYKERLDEMIGKYAKLKDLEDFIGIKSEKTYVE